MTSQQYHIKKIINGGFGLSHDKDGRVTLIEGVIPDETVTAKIWSKNKNLKKGRPQQIIKVSVDRVQPDCKYYKQCGGCNFQHISYSRQLQVKEDIVKDLLARSGNPALQEATKSILAPPLPSPEEYYYRQRIRLQVDDTQTLGFYKRRSNTCVPIGHCLLANKKINTCLDALQHHTAFDRLIHRTESLELLFNPDSNRVTLSFHLSQRPRPADKQHALTLTDDINDIEGIFFTGNDFAPSGHSKLSFTLPALPPHTNRTLNFSWETGGFCQVNLQQNQILIQTVLDFCAVSKTDTVLDLFCGMGNFSIPIAEKAESLLGIEGQGSAIRSAKQNSKLAGHSNSKFMKRPVHDACAELAKAGHQFDIVIIDPPRQGAPGLSEQLSQLTAKRLIYISCDPATLCRDLAELFNHNFQLQKLQPIDMFPQTHHIECVALLEKSPENH